MEKNVHCWKFEAKNLEIDKEIYVNVICATDRENIKFVFEAVSDTIIRINLPPIVCF